MSKSPPLPLRIRYEIVALIVFNLALLIYSYSLPFMQAERYFFFHDKYTLLKSIGRMYESGYYVLTFLVGLFSIAFPVGKLIALLTYLFIPFNKGNRIRTLHWIATIGKWSMLDVFIVAILIVLISARTLTKAEPLPGLYVFTAAILLSMALTQKVQHLANNPPPPDV